MSLHQRILLRVQTLEALMVTEPGPALMGALVAYRIVLDDLKETAAPVLITATPEEVAELKQAVRAAPPQAVVMTWPEEKPAPVSRPKPEKAKPAGLPSQHWLAKKTPEERAAHMASMRAKRASKPEAAPALAPAPAPPPAAPLEPLEAVTDMAHAGLEARHARAKEKLADGMAEHLVAAHTRLPLREVMRLKGVLRDERRGAA